MWLLSSQDEVDGGLLFEPLRNHTYTYEQEVRSNFCNTDALFTHSGENCSNTLTFPRAVGSCCSLHMCTLMSACRTLPVLFLSFFFSVCEP